MYNNYYKHKNNIENNEINTHITMYNFLKDIYNFSLKFIIELIIRVYFPYITFNYIILPYIYYYIFKMNNLPIEICNIYYYNVLRNMFYIDILTNIFSFCISVSSHNGDDLYSFKTKCPNKKEFILRATIGSVNYNYGNYIIDFLHSYLNYQIEHHMFPKLSPLEYTLIAPKIKETCNKYKIPYIQENIFKRVFKLYQVIVLNKRTIKFEDSNLYKYIYPN